MTPAAVLRLMLIAVVAATALAAPATAGASPAVHRAAAQGPEQGERRVVIVSDSIAAGAEVRLVPALEADGWSVTFDAEQNRTTYAAARAVSAHRSELTDTVVLSLGANDGDNAISFRSRVEEVLDQLESVPSVYWLSLHEVRDYYVDTNRILHEAAASRPNLTILDWHAVASATADLTASDGLHLSPSGADAMTDLIRTAVGRPDDPPVTAAPPTTAPAASTPSTVTPAAGPTESDVASPDEDAAEAPSGAGAGDPLPGSEGEERDRGRSADDIAAGQEDRSGGSGWRSVVGWTIGGFLAVVAVLVAVGMGLGMWSLWTTRREPAWAQARKSQNHPAVRAKLRADRIAAARRAAEMPYTQVEAQET